MPSHAQSRLQSSEELALVQFIFKMNIFNVNNFRKHKTFKKPYFICFWNICPLVEDLFYFRYHNCSQLSLTILHVTSYSSRTDI